MNGKSYWIWHYGEYEIFHSMQLHLRREERSWHRPPFWKISTPYISVKFLKTVSCESGFLLCHMNGVGHVHIDGTNYPADTCIRLSSGMHQIEVLVSNPCGLPSIFVESDVCPRDESWQSNYFAGENQPVGWNCSLDAPDKNPEVFPFEYERKSVVSVRKTDRGMLYDFRNEIFGYLNITGYNQNRKLDVYYGESEEEAIDTDFSYLMESVCGSDSYRLRQRAFRYVFIVAADEKTVVSADSEYLPLCQTGSFFLR